MGFQFGNYHIAFLKWFSKDFSLKIDSKFAIPTKFHRKLGFNDILFLKI